MISFLCVRNRLKNSYILLLYLMCICVNFNDDVRTVQKKNKKKMKGRENARLKNTKTQRKYHQI